MAVIDVGEFRVKAAETPPKKTAVVPRKLDPLMTIDVPPPVVPVAVPRLVTTGAGDWNVNWSAAEGADVPAELVTLTSTTRADSAAVTAVIEVAELTVKDWAATEPNMTAVTPVKL